ncbi:MAG: protein kinase [Myxococcota bacterium]
MDPQPPTEDALDELSLGHQAEIGRVASALFGAPQAPVEVGGFAVTRTLGRGAFGTVYEARDAKLGRNVAIKVLARADEASQENLLREASMMATVTHPNVAAVYEVGTFRWRDESRMFIAMEFVAGTTLRRHWEEHTPSEGQLVSLLAQAGRGLAAAHAASVVHRDFKPDNVLVGGDGRVRVVDFGLASTDTAALMSEQDVEVDPESPATATRGPVGTPAYMAPELLAGKPADPRSDQFAFCVTLHEAVCGRRPFAGSTLAELATNIADGTVTTGPRGARSLRVRRVILRGLSPEPDARYPSMDALLADLQGGQWTSRWPWLVGAAAVAGTGLGALVARESTPRTPECAIAPGSIETHFGSERASALATAFVAAAPAYGERSAALVTARLDAWTERWRQAAATSCGRANATPDDRSLRGLEAACLTRARERLAALLATFEDATAATVRHAAKTVRALPKPVRCIDTAALLAAAPADAPGRAEALRIRGGLVAAQAELVAGRYDVARDELEQLQQDAEALQFAPVTAEVGVARAHLDLEAGRYEDSRLGARAAFDTAVGGGDKRTAASATILLAQVGVADHTHLEAAIDWVETGAKLAEPLDDAADISSHLAMVRATLAVTTGDNARAPELLERAVAMLTEEDPAHPDLSTALGNWGTWLLLSGKTSEAIERYKLALQAVQDNLGPNHPEAATWLLGLGSASITVGEFDQAEDYLTRSLELHRKSVGPTHANTIQTLMYLGVLEHNRVDYLAAIAHFDEALRVAESADPVLQPLIAEICLRFADTLSIAEVHDRAKTIVDRAATIYEATYAGDAPRLANVYAVALVAADRAGRREDALSWGLRGLDVSKAVGDENVMTMKLLHETGRVLVDLERYDEALLLLERAAKVLRAGVEDPWRSALVDYERARALWTTDPTRSRALASAALEHLPPAAGEAGRAAIRDWIAAH